jgi:hypothetical protein
MSRIKRMRTWLQPRQRYRQQIALYRTLREYMTRDQARKVLMSIIDPR